MERVLVYLAVVSAVLVVLATALPRLKQRPDPCLDAERLARDVYSVYQSQGAVLGVYALEGVVVNSSGVFQPACAVSARTPTVNSTTLSGRIRVIITAVNGTVVVRRV